MVLYLTTRSFQLRLVCLPQVYVGEGRRAGCVCVRGVRVGGYVRAECLWGVVGVGMINGCVGVCVCAGERMCVMVSVSCVCVHGSGYQFIHIHAYV